MKGPRFNAWLARQRLLLWLRDEFILAPLEPILHPSRWRVGLLGLTLLLCQPLFGWIWSQWLVQPYENLWLRGLTSMLGGALMLPYLTRDISSAMTRMTVTVIAWVEFPLFFSWMYLNNAGSAAWLASFCAMILIYYHVTDLRIATAGMVSGALVAWGLFRGIMPNAAEVVGARGAVDMVVIAFSWGASLLLSLSSANLRREQLRHALTTIGIMAHELRTPLSTAALIGDAIQLEVQRQPDSPRALQLDKLALRLHTLVRNMNHQIDTQIANAKLLQLPRLTEQVSAAKLVTDVVAAYPYQTSRQRECVKVIVHADFAFESSARQFSQVLDNLIKNALHSLMAADSQYAHGALRIEVGMHHAKGRIVVTDQGMGIEASLLSKIFKPFFSSDLGTGHGLGLAFCQQVVQSAGGTIQAKSKYAVGAIFTIELPLAA